MRHANEVVVAERRAGMQRATPLLRGILEGGVADGHLRADIDLQLLVPRVLSQFVEASIRWAHDEISLARFEAEASYAGMLALVAASTPAYRRRAERALAEAEAALRAA